MIELVGPIHDSAQCTDEAVGHAAAHAAVSQRDGFTVMPGNQALIDVQLAEVVDQHGETRPARVFQQVVEHRRLAGAEKPPDDRERQR